MTQEDILTPLQSMKIYVITTDICSSRIRMADRNRKATVNQRVRDGGTHIYTIRSLCAPGSA